MTTQTSTTDREEPRSRRSGSSGAGSPRRGNKGMSTETIIDIVERLGVVDLVIDRLRARIEDVDTDELMDDVTDYLRRNPEVLVVALGTITIAAGVIVYLSRRELGHERPRTSRTRYEAHGDEADESESTRRTVQAARRRNV